jgi:hypothetical protein
VSNPSIIDAYLFSSGEARWRDANLNEKLFSLYDKLI